MNPYVPVAIFLGVAAVAATAFVLVPGLLARRKPNPAKSEAYECGVEPTSAVSGRLPVRFYLIAMLFILFDVEVVFIYPIAIELRAYGSYALAETVTFVVLLFVAFVYVWRRGALQWS